MRIVLASRSPRRRALLAAHGFEVKVRAVEIEEHLMPSESPEAAAERLARAKAEAAGAFPDAPVLAADTLVALGDEVLGKPRSRQQARWMLQRLSGAWHRVITGVAVLRKERLVSSVCCTHVRFRPLSEEEIEAYLASGEAMDKAGAYGAQAGGASFIVEVQGPLDNVIGLPVALVRRLLA